MDDLHRFQIPHDPEAFHQLHWSPGQHGKGLINPDDGSVHTWPVGERSDGDPSHRRYIMETLDRDPYHEYPDRTRESYHPFWIRPEGNIFMLTPSQQGSVKTVLNADPRLAPPQDEDSWRFADARTQFRALPMEEQRRMWQEDPLGVERSTEWDPPGDVQHGNENIEWVPTHVLKKFVEYDRRPGGDDSMDDPERWNALGEHIKNNGFRNPVWLDYNPDTGHAHLSEGNHRVQLSLDHGIPAVPTRVIRSRRTSPTQIPVDLQPQPEWEDRFSPNGYRVPEMMKPSHIGLPTVPAPGSERTASTFTNWTPGQPGKGLIAENGVHTWNVTGQGEQYDPDRVIGYPTHMDYKGMHRLESQGDNSEFWITPQGEVSFFQPRHVDEATRQLVQQAHPEIKLTDTSNQDAWGNGWTFGKLASLTMYHVAPTHARESILRNGLQGHDQLYRTLYGPHDVDTYKHGQPTGNYFYDSLANVYGYIPTLATKIAPKKWTYPGDFPEHFIDHGVYPEAGYSHAYVEQQPPEDFNDWDDDAQEQWYEQQHENATPYDHNNPEHRALLPRNLQGWDIWKVNTNGLPLTTDPEEFLVDKNRVKNLKPLTPDEIPDPDEHGWYDGDTTQPRWMTHQHVEPHRLELQDHVPAWKVNDEWASNTLDDSEDVPYEMMHLHPRHIIPGRVPPEVRKIWGKELDWQF